MKYLKTAICFVLISALQLMSQKGKATEAQAEAEADAIAYVLKHEYGWDIKSYYSHGSLREGERASFSKTFYSGVEYALVAGGCDYARDIDIEIYDENYNLIEKDTDTGKNALVTFTPRWSGTFHIKVKMYDASATGLVHWVLQYGYR